MVLKQKINDPILMYIFHKQCEIMHKKFNKNAQTGNFSVLARRSVISGYFLPKTSKSYILDSKRLFGVPCGKRFCIAKDFVILLFLDTFCMPKKAKSLDHKKSLEKKENSLNMERVQDILLFFLFQDTFYI